jgi:hypothetical protein
MDYLGEWGGGGPGHSWAQMALALLVPFNEKSSLVEKLENLPGEANKVRINADVCKLTENLREISQENPGNSNGAKIRQTGSRKAQSSSFALKERSLHTVHTIPHRA